jgi:linear primary-alkylsulfatase
MRRILVLGLVAGLAASCANSPSSPPAAPDVDAHGNTAATSITQQANAEAVRGLPLADPQDFEDATRGLIASDPAVVIRDAAGKTVWDAQSYDFITGDAPPSVNPSLWRQAKLNNIHGLFQVTEGVFQVRGYDISNMTWIRGTSGWIIVDTLTSRETAAAAVALARRELGDAPVVAVILTHSHIDHFGGIAGVLTDAQRRDGQVRIVAPRGFIEESTSENVIAGIAMSRRASFMFGIDLPHGERGHVDTGLGKGPARGAIDIVRPTDFVDHTPQEMEIDGVRFTFQYAPESEAPAELTFYLPERKAFCGAEVVSHNLHNLYTLRGAKVRDALRWSDYIEQAIELFGGAEVVFASHHWPVWGNARVIAYLKRQRDAYRYIHDQTVRLANDGYTPREIAERLELPASLRNDFAVRGYYGTVRHNAKAVYQAYFGWYDGNPANLDPLPPAEEGARYVEAMGGASKVREHAERAYAKGDYRWAATLLNDLVFAEPEDAAARELLARTYDQLGYRAESGPWRDVYLSGASELRHGAEAAAFDPAAAIGLLRHTPLDELFTAMATRLDGPKADGKTMTVNFVFTDLGESHVLTLENAVLHHRRSAEPDPAANVTVRLTKDFFLRLTTRQAGLRDMIFSDEFSVDGSRMDLLSFFSLLGTPDGKFAIVTP